MKITEKQKNIILNNLSLVDIDDIKELVIKGIDNISREKASEIVGDILETIEELKEIPFDDIY